MTKTGGREAPEVDYQRIKQKITAIPAHGRFIQNSISYHSMMKAAV